MAAYTTIDDPSAFFQAENYTGAGANTTVTFSGNSDLKPDLLWIRNRGAGYGSFWVDSTRGISYAQNSSNAPYLQVQDTALENNNQNWMQSVNTDGFTTGISEHINSNSGSSFVAWAWKVNGGTTSTNNDGNITTTVQVNTTAGISIGTYTGNASGSATIGHGLGAIPDLVIIKGRDGNGLGGAAQYWTIGAPNVFGNGTSNHVFLDNQNAMASNTSIWRNENFTSSIIPMGGHAAINGNTAAYVFYAFKNVQGFSKIGKYKGNDQDPDGKFVYTGFKPAFVLVKNYDSSLYHWQQYDTARSPTNEDHGDLFTTDTADAESTGGNSTAIDLLSNGFKCRGGYDGFNGASTNILYIAFAENPFVTSTGIPATAR